MEESQGCTPGPNVSYNVPRMGPLTSVCRSLWASRVLRISFRTLSTSARIVCWVWGGHNF